MRWRSRAIPSSRESNGRIIARTMAASRAVHLDFHKGCVHDSRLCCSCFFLPSYTLIANLKETSGPSSSFSPKFRHRLTHDAFLQRETMPQLIFFQRHPHRRKLFCRYSSSEPLLTLQHPTGLLHPRSQPRRSSISAKIQANPPGA